MPYKDSEARKQYAAAYAKRWREANPEKARAADQRHRKKHQEELASRRRTRYAADSTAAKQAAKKYAKKHPDRVRARAARFKEKDPEAYRTTQRRAALKKLYGLTIEDYERLLSEQNGVCAICKRVCKTGRRLAVDHCHETGRVRGLLCANCNHVLGKLNDDVELLQAAVSYLRRGTT